MQLVQNLTFMVGRIMIVGIFIWDGIFILQDSEATASYIGGVRIAGSF